MKKKPDYKRFCLHLEEWDKLGICHGWSDLCLLAKKYNTEIPKVVDGKVIFE